MPGPGKRCSKRQPPANSLQGRWTPEEDAQLLQLVSEKGRRWTEIGGMLGRYPLSCRDRWLMVRCAMCISVHVRAWGGVGNLPLGWALQAGSRRRFCVWAGRLCSAVQVVPQRQGRLLSTRAPRWASLLAVPPAAPTALG